MAAWLDGIVLENYQWTDRLYSLKIQSPLKEFKAGQFVRVALDINGEQVARPYSLVNSPGEEFLEIYFDIVPHGLLTKELVKLKKGDMVKVADNPSGFLTISEVPEARHLWMLATGTGLGPFLSSLKTSEPWGRFEKIIFAHSVRSGEELTYKDTINQLLESHPDKLVYVPFVTREKVSGTINNRITTALTDGSFEKAAGETLSPDSSHVMLCGNAKMIAEVTEILETRGMKKHRRREPGHIATEKYH